jgi:hypothetical protein
VLPLLGYAVFAKTFGPLIKTDMLRSPEMRRGLQVGKTQQRCQCYPMANASSYFSFSFGDRDWVRDAIGFVEARELCVAALELVISRKVIVNRREILRGASRSHRETI